MAILKRRARLAAKAAGIPRILRPLSHRTTEALTRAAELEFVDVHSHLLPGVDDGAKTLEESLELLRNLELHGAKKLVLTPHYIANTSQTSPLAENKKLFKKFQSAAKKAGVKTELYLGNELYIDPNLSRIHSALQITTLNAKKHLLIELPMSGSFDGYEDILYDLRAEGFEILLAHPERYATFQKDFRLAKDLAASGILFQSNLGSLVGQYGKHAQKTVEQLIEHDLIFCFGSDLHHSRDFSELDRAKARLLKLYKSEDKVQKILLDNPASII